MRPFTFILTFLLLVACSPQKQLARFLTKHPELHRIDTLTIHDTIYMEGAKKSKNITPEKLDSMLQAAQKESTQQTSQGKTTQKASAGADTSLSEKQQRNDKATTVEVNGAAATLTANADGSFTLEAERRPDTIPIKNTVPVPTYYTDTKIEQVIVYKMKKAEKFFFGIGIAVAIICAIILVWWIFKRFYKIK